MDDLYDLSSFAWDLNKPEDLEKLRKKIEEIVWQSSYRYEIRKSKLTPFQRRTPVTLTIVYFGNGEIQSAADFESSFSGIIISRDKNYEEDWGRLTVDEDLVTVNSKGARNRRSHHKYSQNCANHFVLIGFTVIKNNDYTNPLRTARIRYWKHVTFIVAI